MILIRKNLFSGKKENWDQITPLNSPWQHMKKRGVWASWAQSVRAWVWGEDTGRHLAQWKKRPPSSMGLGEMCLQAHKYGQSYVLSVEARAMLAPTSKLPEDREFVVDTGASMHMMSKKGFEPSRNGYSAELQDSYDGGNGQRGCKQTRKHKFTFTILISSWRCKYSTTSLQFYHLKSSAKKRIFLWVVQQSKTRLTKNGQEFLCKTEKFVPLVVPGVSSDSGIRSSSTAPPQDSSGTISSPATERSDKQAPGDRRDSKKSQNKNKKECDKQATGDRLRDLPEWLEEFTENLEDTETPVPAHVSQDSGSERPTKVVSKSRIQSICVANCQKTEIVKYACESRWKTHWWCSTSSNWVRWLGNSRSQSRQRRRWIGTIIDTQPWYKI